MTYTLKFEHPQFPQGKEFSVGNLGLIENGGSLEVDEETERLFLMTYGKTIEEAYTNRAGFTLSGSSSLSSEELKSYLPAQETETNQVVEVEVEDASPPEHVVEGV